MKYKKFAIWSAGIAVVAIFGFVAVKSTLSPDSMPAAVTQVKGEVAPNHVFQTYKYPYKLRLKANSTKLFSAPAGTRGAKYLGTVSDNKVTKDITATRRSDLNGSAKTGYIKFKDKAHTYWVSAQQVSFRDLNALAGNNAQVETAIKAGLKLVGHSGYDYGGGRNIADVKHHKFDCSSFVRYCYRKAGITLGDLSSVTTYTLVEMGQPEKFKNLKRGDLFFFTNSKGQVNSHVAMYLGNNLFLHDHRQSDTGGVGISTLNAPSWRKETNGTVRRIAV